MTVPYLGKRYGGNLAGSGAGTQAGNYGDTLWIPLQTFNDSGGSININTGATTLTKADIEIFKNGEITPRATDSGYFIGDTGTSYIDASGQTQAQGADTGQYADRAGLRRIGIRIMNTADDANFYQVGATYHVAIDNFTITGQSGHTQTVRTFIAWFEIGDSGAGLGGGYSASDTIPANVKEIDHDTGVVGHIAMAYTDSGGSVRSNLHEIATDTGVRDNFVRSIQDTGGSVRANVFEVRSDTGPAANLAQSLLDTGVIIADMKKVAGDTGAAANILQRYLDTGGLGLVDTGAVSNAVWDTILTGSSHNDATSAGRRLRTLQDFGVYALAAVWVDEVAGSSTGTTSFEDATVTNRANDFDNAQTVAAAVDLSAIYVTNGNSITLTATINNFAIGQPGSNWTIALGGQDIGGCDINDANVSGTGTGTDPHFHNCLIGTATLPPAEFYHCGIGSGGGTLTVGSAGAYRFVDCYSDVAGSSAPTVDLGAAVGATTMEFRRWSGGLTLNNVAVGDVISVDVVSGGTITVNGTGGTVVIRGMCNVVDGSSGSVSITKTSVLNQNEITDAVWDESDTGHSDTGTFGRLRQGVNLKKIVGDTGAAANLLQSVLDTGVITANAHKIAGDTGAAANLQQSVLDTGVILANINKIKGDTGSAANLLQAVLDTGVITANVHKVFADTGAAANALQHFLDTGGTRPVDTGYFATGQKDTGAIANAVWGALKSSHGDTGSFGEELGQGVNVTRIWGDSGAPSRIDRAGRTEVLGTCAALGTTTSVIASALSPTSAVDSQFNGRIIIFDKDTTTAALRGQATDITAYTHATLTFTVTALTTAPASGDTFCIV